MFLGLFFSVSLPFSLACLSLLLLFFSLVFFLSLLFSCVWLVFLALFLCFCSWHEQLQNIKHRKVSFINAFCFLFRKGHLTWPLNLQYFSLFFCLSFCFLEQENPIPPPPPPQKKNWSFCLFSFFSVSLSFSLACFFSPPSRSLFPSLSFFSFFLVFFLFSLLAWCYRFFSFLPGFFALVSWEEQLQTIN